ncbi:hypothetical protein [Nonomuraea endophytica]|uniref:hypothetical protein n=1 Tax=Nonomuraea endophytica TaxID=714136 RepID=UPI0037CACE58
MFGVEVTLMVGLVFWLVEWAERSTRPSKRAPGTRRGADTKHTLFRALLAGGTAALAAGLGGVLITTGLGNVLTSGLAIGLVTGLAGGLAVGLGGRFWGRLGGGLGGGNHHAWLACTLAVTRLVITGRLPLRIMDFLDDAHRLGLLRAVGPIYQFRHAALHDHLARTPARSIQAERESFGYRDLTL